METLRAYWSIISTILTVVIIPLIVWLWKQHKKSEKRQEAVELGLQALLRDRIVQAYYHYIEREWITLHGLENINAIYEQYHALGGNGSITTLVETLRKLEVRDN